MAQSVMRSQGSHASHATPRRAGQALLELAVFGALIIMMLGILINYGLNYDFSQYNSMRSFRQALGIAASPTPLNPDSSATKPDPKTLPDLTWGSGSYSLIQDRHIPNPGDQFGIGSVAPVASSASVMRTHDLGATAEHEAELPRTRVMIQGKEFDCPSAGSGCTTAGFRTVMTTGIINKKNRCQNDSTTLGGIDRYETIFGSSNINITRCAAGNIGQIVLIDSCEGEMIDQSACLEQARQMVDSKFCTLRCERSKTLADTTKPPTKPKDPQGHWQCPPNVPLPPLPGGGGGGTVPGGPCKWVWDPDAEVTCERICAEPLGVPPLLPDAPWYTVRDAKGRFVNIDKLFAATKVMGVQTDTTNRTSTIATREKAESPKAIATKSDVDFKNITERQMVYRRLTWQGGERKQEPINSETGDRASKAASGTWSTSW